MATRLDPQFGRDVLRCDGCRLVQFPTRSGNCRCCGAPYIETAPAPEAPPEAEKLGVVLPEIGGVVRVVRIAHNLTLVQVASSVGMTKQQLSQIESGERTVSVGTVSRLAEALRITAGALVQMAIVAAQTPPRVVDVPVQSVGCGA